MHKKTQLMIVYPIIVDFYVYISQQAFLVSVGDILLLY